MAGERNAMSRLPDCQRFSRETGSATKRKTFATGVIECTEKEEIKNPASKRDGNWGTNFVFLFVGIFSVTSVAKKGRL